MPVNEGVPSKSKIILMARRHVPVFRRRYRFKTSSVRSDAHCHKH